MKTKMMVFGRHHPQQEAIATILPHTEVDDQNLSKANQPSNLEFNDRYDSGSLSIRGPNSYSS